jgi:hypothetical protein
MIKGLLQAWVLFFILLYVIEYGLLEAGMAPLKRPPYDLGLP